MALIADLFYLPPIEFFVAACESGKIYMDSNSIYQKQTYRNRARILLANKVDDLSVPVLGGRGRAQYKEIKIDHSQKWKNVHLRGIQSGYGKAPFFEFFYPYLEPVYDKNLTFLWDMNWELLTVCLRLLGLGIPLLESGEMAQDSQFEDIRGLISPKASFLDRTIMSVHPYGQMFGRDFEPNLSILDLLFCKGTESKEVLVLSKKIG